MPYPLLQIDAFTNKPFGGNPAAVCMLDAPMEPAWMHQVAAEMNLAETAFVYRRPEGDFSLRWFTPTVEVELCGHATLATAHALWKTRRLAPDAVARFHTMRSGVLVCTRRESGLIEMDFPTTPASPVEPPPGLLASLGIRGGAAVARSKFDYLVQVTDEAQVRSLQVNMRDLGQIPTRGVIVTAAAAPSPEGFDFVSRFFGPHTGVDEDPVTGSAHCCLGEWWQRRLGKSEFRAFQASRRGGVVELLVQGERTILRGHAVITLRGELTC